MNVVIYFKIYSTADSGDNLGVGILMYCVEVELSSLFSVKYTKSTYHYKLLCCIPICQNIPPYICNIIGI